MERRFVYFKILKLATQLKPPHTMKLIVFENKSFSVHVHTLEIFHDLKCPYATHTFSIIKISFTKLNNESKLVSK